MANLFETFKINRAKQDFNSNFNTLCESIVKSGIDFDTYWKEHALPVLMKSSLCENTEELLMEFNPLSRASWGGLFGGNKPNPAQAAIPNTPQGSVIQNPDQRAAQFANDNDAGTQLDARTAKAKQGLENSVNAIKKRFLVAMKDFHTAVSNDAKKSGDAKQWKLADLFYKKMMTTVTPQADQFLQNLKVKFGGDGHKAEFQKQFGQSNINVGGTDFPPGQQTAPGAQAQPATSQPSAPQTSNINVGGANFSPQQQTQQPSMRTAGAQQPAGNYSVGGANFKKQPQMQHMKKENADPFLASLKKSAGNRPTEASFMG